MTDRLTDAQIKEFWTEQALKHGKAPSASWSDTRVMEMEVREIAKLLSPNDRVLDVGCANGFTTLQLASRLPLEILGLDYIPNMIEEANAHLAAVAPKLTSKVRFAVGDIVQLSEPDAAYDKVVVVRVIINLGSWERQCRALAECTRVLKPGGVLLLSEATVQGWERLNTMRREWGLNDIPMPSFNLYLDEEKVVAQTAGSLELVDIINFASTYFVGTRVIKPLLARLAPREVNSADPAMEFNRWLSQAPSWGDYGTQKLFVFRKR
jgi:ubiquinone/menaquinone biosynthesis C-methylase UbiE